MKIWILWSELSYDPSGADAVVAVFDHEPSEQEQAAHILEFSKANCTPDNWGVVERELITA